VDARQGARNPRRLPDIYAAARLRHIACCVACSNVASLEPNDERENACGPNIRAILRGDVLACIRVAWRRAGSAVMKTEADDRCAGTGEN